MDKNISYLRSFLKQGLTDVSILAGAFSGASLILNPSHSKRKILGLYEHVLNPWLCRILPTIEVLWDVGANDGYFTYGCAYKIQQHHGKGYVMAFEPDISHHSPLPQPANWPQYKTTIFEFLPYFVGASSDKRTVTLNQEWGARPHLHSKRSLIKVDVEGAEVEVLRGATSLLEPPHHWVVEVHGDHLLDPVLSYFKAAQRSTDVIPYQPHWLLGAEARTIKTSWVVTQPDSISK